MKARIGTFLLGFALAGCGTSQSAPDASNPYAIPANCLVIDASACDTPMPSYADAIAPLLDQACNSTCHAPGVGPWPLNNYSDVLDWAPIIAGDIATCRMPPEDAGAGNVQLMVAQRTAVVTWATCGAPDN
jgi:hypothetical protein